MKKSQGFTLIELLVVIAIIGILSAVVLASLNSARAKGSDAAVKSQLSSLKAEAALFYDGPQSYAGLFDGSNQATKLYLAAKASGSGAGAASSTANTWAAYANLKSASTTYFCVDYTTVSTSTATQPDVTDGDCDSNNVVE
jgi:prepilin-type N-terminal cleavage/methylation domain-containing protein